MSDSDRFFLPEWQAAQRDIGFAQAVSDGRLLHVSGTTSLDADFRPLNVGDFNAQLEFVYRQIGRTLAEFGLGFGDVVREVMYVTDMDALAAAIPLRKAFYGNGPFPASTGIEVRRLLFPELLVEIQVDALLPGQRN
ncbi:RidA family protein [Sphingosinicella xenopeptidilytica]|uniref:RidA family protein n=2 Tax=Sphingosinicella xenopeptidilytica TaxID=364098 RepID=A0ABW3C733_SPHXN